MAITIQHKRDTAANWTSNNPTLSAGEIGVETDTGKFKFGDGSTAWSSLGYFETAAPSGPSFVFQGSTSGYVSGGYGGPGASNIIQKFPFSADANATDVGDLTAARMTNAGHSSSTNGYTSGGFKGNGTPTPIVVDTIDKFPFSSNANATDVGDMSYEAYNGMGNSSEENGYVSGGTNPYVPTAYNNIEKFPFSGAFSITDVGDLTTTISFKASQNSPTHGFVSGNEQIDKFPFSSDANATDVGNLSCCRSSVAGQNTSTYGYISGGIDPTVTGCLASNIIDKFAFSSGGTATDVGDLSCGRAKSAGQSSTANGYNSGGRAYIPGDPSSLNVIDKFPFSSDANATDVGDILNCVENPAGQQV